MVEDSPKDEGEKKAPKEDDLVHYQPKGIVL
jgi:hypothetical protein